MGLLSAREKADYRNSLRILVAMAFVPVPSVKDALTFLKRVAPALPRIRNFNDHFDSTCMNGQYSVEKWNFFKYHQQSR